MCLLITCEYVWGFFACKVGLIFVDCGLSILVISAPFRVLNDRREQYKFCRSVRLGTMGSRGQVSKSAANDLWKKVCRELKQILHPDVYSRWIDVIQPNRLVDHTLILNVDNDFYQSWLEENYVPLIHKAISTVTSEQYDITFEVTSLTGRSAEIDAVLDPSAQKDIKPPKPVKKASRRAIAHANLNPRFTFNNFIIGSSNSFAHAAGLAVAQAPARAYNPLFIYGGVGLGKTHLMVSIGHHVLQNSRAKICYITSEEFLNEYISALTNRSLANFRKKYRNTDLLLIDDIHFLASKERLQEEFFHTFNSLFDARKQIVMTSDRPASEISGLEQRLVSRFEWGLVTELESPDLETRLAILKHRQEQAEHQLPDELLLFIAENIRSNIRRLEGSLIRAISYSSLTGQELTLESLKYLLRDALEQEQKSVLTFADIQRAVADHFDVRLSDMTSKCRQRSVAVPRQIAMYLCRRITKSSFPDIAQAFGKTHATVLHAYRTVDNRMDIDPDTKRSVSTICSALGHAG